MLLTVSNLAKSFSGKDLFKSVSFVINEGNKVALVGSNGSGKSTLVKIISKLETADSGNIAFAKDRNTSYLPQEFEGDESMTGIEYFKSFDLKEHMFYPILEGLNISKEIAENPIKQMSGGQQTKILLTKFLLESSDVLLLDEPTNNLDIPSLLWLESFLKESKKAMLIVSHDIEFLNNVTNKVFELEDETLKVEGGKYGDYLERKEKEYRKAMEDYKKNLGEINKIESRIKLLSDKGLEIDRIKPADNDKQAAGARRDKSSGGQSHSKVLKKKIEQLGKYEKPFEGEAFAINVFPKNVEGDLEISAEDAVIGNEKDKPLFGPFNLSVPFGDRICILGMNGVGKSTLLRTLTGEIKTISGILKITEGMVFGDLMQQHQRANRSSTAIELFRKETKLPDEKAYHLLKKMGLSEENFNQSISDLSAGTRARLLFAIFTSLGVNVLVLDEPTNHLDMEAISALKDLLKVYKGTIILISHNRWFIKNIEIDNFYEIDNSNLTRIKDFDEYIKIAASKSKNALSRLKRLIKV